MGLIDILNKKQVEAITDPNQLTAQELQLALQLFKSSTIRGEQVELFYSLILKLQNQYTVQQSK